MTLPTKTERTFRYADLPKLTTKTGWNLDHPVFEMAAPVGYLSKPCRLDDHAACVVRDTCDCDCHGTGSVPR